MNLELIKKRLVRYGELKPCKTAFIDTHTPGSNKKENYTIIGGGVSENPDQFVHIDIPHGFNIGAAGQPPKCHNSLHSHRTAEVFFVLSGRWRFFWGRFGNTGDVILEKGDIFNIPTEMFRGFENVGNDYGMLIAILGGDDAGGGVIWAPEVLDEAKKHGLILSEKGKIYDTKIGQNLPEGEKEMPLLSDEELEKFNEPTVLEVVPNYVARYWDLVSLSNKKPVKVISKNGLIIDRPGFEVDFITEKSCFNYENIFDEQIVLIPFEGHWRLKILSKELILNPGDTISIPKNIKHTIEPAMTERASMYTVKSTLDKPGSTWKNN